MSYPKNHASPHDDDAAAGIEITEDFERFTQRNDVFSRAFWDDTVRTNKIDGFFASYRMEATPRRGDGFTQRDFALRNAAWLIRRDDRSPRRSGAARRFSGPDQLRHASCI
jgi:epoxyqueuosine reductase